MRDGSKEEALFATADIEPGTRLICETPVVAVTQTGETLGNVYSSFLTLSPSEQASIWDLKAGPAPPHLHAEAAFIDSLIRVYLDLYTKSQSQDLTLREQSVFDRLGPQLQHLCLAWRIAARFHLHRQCLLNIPLNQRYRIPPHVPVSGLFLTAARLTHSCMPNCFVAYNTQQNHVTVHATKAIKKGTLLTASIIGERIWYESAAARANLLRNAANIICLCEACGYDEKQFDADKRAAAKATFTMHEQQRRKLYLNIVYLSSTLTQMLCAANPFLMTCAGFMVHPDAYEAVEQKMAEDAQNDMEDANKKLIHTLQMLGMIGCADLEVVRWRNVQAAVLLDKLKKWNSAEESAMLALQITERCVGADGEEVAGLRGAVESIGQKRRNQLMRLGHF
jgi:hypothetical protein